MMRQRGSKLRRRSRSAVTSVRRKSLATFNGLGAVIATNFGAAARVHARGQ